MVRGTAKKRQVYPRMLCYTTCEGLAFQNLVDNTKLQWHELLSMDELERLAGAAGLELDICTVDQSEGELHGAGGENCAFVDVTGDELCPRTV